MSRALLILALAVLVAGCASRTVKSPEETTREFYQHYLQSIANVEPANTEQAANDRSRLIKYYVSAETAKRIEQITGLDEQEILQSDYFTYSQDYDAEWIKRLETGKSVSFMGGVIVPVSLGLENNSQMLLEVFLRQEASRWKIYRVLDKTDSYEQPIFDDGRFNAAVKHDQAIAAAEK